MSIHYRDDTITLHHGDALDVLRTLPDQSVDCCVTSPPYYGLRDYGVAGQLGAEPTPAEYVARLVAVFAQVRRVLAADGTCWLNLGDSYAGSWGAQGKADDNAGLHRKVLAARGLQQTTRTGSIRDGMPPPKNLLGMPWRVAFALQDDGWILRNAIIWHKQNAMPESVTDRLASRYELLFLLTRSRRYWFDLDPIREAHTSQGIFRDDHRRNRDDGVPRLGSQQGQLTAAASGHGRATDAAAFHPLGKNPGDVWSMPTQPFTGSHFAAFPRELPRRCIAAGCKPHGIVLDPFHGSGTTGAAAEQLGHRYVGIDLSAEYLDLSLRTRLSTGALWAGDA